MRRREVMAAFHAYNRLLWGGALETPRLSLRMRGPECAWYDPWDDRPGLLQLRPDPSVHPGSWRCSLVHEMVHMAVQEPEADDHGPLFVAEANRVGALLGLDPIGTGEGHNWPPVFDDPGPHDGNISDD